MAYFACHWVEILSTLMAYFSHHWIGTDLQQKTWKLNDSRFVSNNTVQ